VIRGRSIWDALMVALVASLTLWPDVPTVEVALVMVVLAGNALGGGE
jgi:hypothetical protein